MDAYELEARLIKFAVSIIELARRFAKDYSGEHLAHQIIRSGTAPALHYAEAQDAESIKDFVHKMKMSLKELRETSVSLRIAGDAMLCRDQSKLMMTYEENSELIAIFVSSIKTAKKRGS